MKTNPVEDRYYCISSNFRVQFIFKISLIWENLTKFTHTKIESGFKCDLTYVLSGRIMKLIAYKQLYFKIYENNPIRKIVEFQYLQPVIDKAEQYMAIFAKYWPVWD